MGGSVKSFEIFLNCKIAHGYALSNRIAKKVIEKNGDNAFLGEQKGLYSNVRDNVNEIHHGITRKDYKKIDPPPVMNFPPIFQPRDNIEAVGGEEGVEVMEESVEVEEGAVEEAVEGEAGMLDGYYLSRLMVV